VAKSKARFSAVEVARLAKRVEPKTRLYHDGGGLYLCVDKRGGTASWLFRYSLNGKAHTAGLGGYPAVSLAKARAKAEAARSVKLDGADPIGERRAARAAQLAAAAKAMTFRQCAEAYISDHRAGWSGRKTGAQWEASLSTYAYPVLGDLPVQDVDTGLVMKVLKSEVKKPDGAVEGTLWTARPETASRVRSRIENILDWAETNGHRPQGKNPARWKGHLENNLPAKSRVRAVVGHAALPAREVPAFMQQLRGREGLSSRALEFVVLTAARTSEVLEARWAEFDLESAVWVVPAARMKARTEHRVPLSSRAVEILTDLKAAKLDPRLVFPGKTGRPISNMSLLMQMRRMKRDDITAHGFRSTFRDWCADRGVARDLAEVCLAHAISSKAEAAYLRSDVLERRRPIMQDWADFCSSSMVSA
jgi:integrase